jgi:hypothetical protein
MVGSLTTFLFLHCVDCFPHVYFFSLLSRVWDCLLCFSTCTISFVVPFFIFFIMYFFYLSRFCFSSFSISVFVEIFISLLLHLIFCWDLPIIIPIFHYVSHLFLSYPISCRQPFLTWILLRLDIHMMVPYLKESRN